MNEWVGVAIGVTVYLWGSLFVLALCRAAKRADEDTERQMR